MVFYQTRVEGAASEGNKKQTPFLGTQRGKNGLTCNFVFPEKRPNWSPGVGLAKNHDVYHSFINFTIPIRPLTH